ncbi:TIGR03086 family protein [Mycolicibacterium rhodesiae NBB3]|uniref:TIGR03086 family protein n=1 Tax=Mycolicibacterium rhodesiae (strain NBB3) TaxID=710685 RepID=G8RPM1_MYCRN|nr:TIGR03086 family metal-binding protein [Mycolicibacterium rhodesiae]AEV72584.1 TIGR03086 family protein [Mycolicibacterium rhodesiae NBB3]
MPDDLRPGPDSPPVDELECAEATFAVLGHVLHGIADDDLNKQTPCREFDVASLTDHLMNSITVLGGAAGAQFPERDRSDSVERQVVLAGRPALDAWKRRGLDGTVAFGDNEAPAKVMAGILSLEFLVHAWDYAAAVGREVNAPDSLSDYVMGLARTIITPQGRSNAGFDEPIEMPEDAGSLQKLLAYTGRRPD